MSKLAIRKIRAIDKKYGKILMMNAITYLFNKGIETIKNMDIEAAYSELQASTSTFSIFSSDQQKKILYCCRELAQFDVCDILHYIQTDLRLYNAASRSCLLVQVEYAGSWWNYAFPAETDLNAVKRICDGVEQQALSQGKFVYQDMLDEAFDKAGLKPLNSIPWDVCLAYPRED